VSEPQGQRQGEAIAVLGVQMAEVIRDVQDLRMELRDHRDEHKDTERARISGRRWTVTTILAALILLEAPIGYIIAHLH
jgi:hypothetical protein